MLPTAEKIDGQPRKHVHGSTQHVGEMLVETNATFPGVGSREGDGHGQNGIRAESRFGGGSIERDHRSVQFSLVSEHTARQRALKLSANICCCATAAQTLISLWITVPKLESFSTPGRCARGYGCGSADPTLQDAGCQDRGSAAAAEDLSAGESLNLGHRLRSCEQTQLSNRVRYSEASP